MSSTTKTQTSEAKKGQDNNNKEELSDSESEIKEKMEKNSKKTVGKSKKIKDDSDSEEEDDEDDEDREELKPGLLDLPLEVTGARERKKVERLALSFHKASKDKKTEICEGKGTKLGDCPQLEHQLQKMKVEDLKPLHKLLFNRLGAPNEIKKNIRRFNGFSFDKDSSEFEKKKNSLDKLTTSILKKMCEVMCLERGGTKDDIVTRVLEFLLKPELSATKHSQAKKPSSKKTKKAKNSSTAKNSKKSEDEMKSESGSEEEENDKNDDEDDEKNEKHEKNEKTEDDDKNDKNDKTQDENNVKEKDEDEPKSDEPKKETKKVDNKTAKGKNKLRKRVSDSESSDEEPLVKKGKMPPTDDELKDLIKQILDGANLEEITMKTVCKQVYAKFPQFDLSSRKEFIKSTVRSIIS